MVKTATLASVASIVAGSWDVYAYLALCRSGCLPASYTAPSQGILGLLFASLSVVLVAVGLVGFVGPKTIFYAGVVSALLVVALEVVSYASIGQFYFYTTLILVVLSLLLAVGAVRAKTGVSEQSHPLNLPVFG